MQGNIMWLAEGGALDLKTEQQHILMEATVEAVREQLVHQELKMLHQALQTLAVVEVGLA
jgi:hypothetical protein